MDEYLTRAEVATRLRLSAQTLANQASRGDGPPYIRFGGGRCLYPLADLLAWERENMR